MSDINDIQLKNKISYREVISRLSFISRVHGFQNMERLFMPTLRDQVLWTLGAEWHKESGNQEEAGVDDDQESPGAEIVLSEIGSEVQRDDAPC